MERSAIRVGRRCFLGRHHAGLLPPLALVAFSPIHVSTSLFAWLSSCSNDNHESLKCRRGSYAGIHLQLVRIIPGKLLPVYAHVEPLHCAKYLSWTSPPVPRYGIRATIYSKSKDVLLFLKIVGYYEYGTFASICFMIQEAHTTASVF